MIGLCLTHRVWTSRTARTLLRVTLVLGGVVGLWSHLAAVWAQQRIGYVDTEYMLNQMPEYATVQQKLDELEQKWRKEIEKKQKKVRTLEREFEARRLLYTEEERKRKQEAIETARTEVEQLRQQYFGPEGKLYTRQKELMRPLQERILKATQDVATSAGYDYVLDKKGEALFLFARKAHDLSDRVLRELGINVNQQESGQQ